MDGESTYIFFNLTNLQTYLLNRDVMWRGAQEKESQTIQLFIKALTIPEQWFLMHVHPYVTIC